MEKGTTVCMHAAIVLGFLATSAAFAQSTLAIPVISEQVSPLEVITAEAQDGHTATAVARKPPGQGPFPAVVLLHGGLNEWDVDRLKQAALSEPTRLLFLAAGYVQVNATFRSRGEDPQTKTALWDCLAIIDHVKKMPEVDPKSVVVMGGSGGGSLALEVAGETELCAIGAGEPATVLFTGMFTKDFGQVGDSGSTRAEPIMKDPRQYYTPELQQFTEEKIRKIKCPMFIAHGDVHDLKNINFPIVFPELMAAGQPLQICIYPGESHGFYWGRRGRVEGARRFFEDCNAFFMRYLATQPVPVR